MPPQLSMSVKSSSAPPDSVQQYVLKPHKRASEDARFSFSLPCQLRPSVKNARQDPVALQSLVIRRNNRARRQYRGKLRRRQDQYCLPPETKAERNTLGFVYAGDWHYHTPSIDDDGEKRTSRAAPCRKKEVTTPQYFCRTLDREI